MVNVLETVVDLAVKQVVGQKDNFQNYDMNAADQAKLTIFALLMVLVYLILVLLFGKVLWNSCLCRLLPVKECKSVWHILGLMILLGLILPTSNK